MSGLAALVLFSQGCVNYSKLYSHDTENYKGKVFTGFFKRELCCKLIIYFLF